MQKVVAVDMAVAVAGVLFIGHDGEAAYGHGTTTMTSTTTIHRSKWLARPSRKGAHLCCLT